MYGGSLVLMSKITPFLGKYSIMAQIMQWLMLGIPVGKDLTVFSIRGLVKKLAPKLVGNLASDTSGLSGPLNGILSSSQGDVSPASPVCAVSIDKHTTVLPMFLFVLLLSWLHW